MHGVLKAGEGMMLTDGKSYAKIVFIGDGVSAEDYHEITMEEYNRTMGVDADGNQTEPDQS